MAIIAKFTRTLPAPTATISGGFVFLLSTGWFTDADLGAAGSPIDGGTNSLANGGGDIQAFSDTACTNQLPLEVVTFVTGGTPEAQVWIRTSGYSSGDTITIGKDDTQIAQPGNTATYGRDAVWADDLRAYHLLESTGSIATDSAGNTDGTYQGSLPTLGANFGQDFDGSNNYVDVTNSAIDFSAFTFSARINPDSTSGTKQIFTSDHYNAPVARTWQWRVSGNKIGIICWDSSDVIFINTEGTISLSAHTSYVVHFSFDGSNYKTFVDGVKDLDIANTSQIRPLQTPVAVIGVNNATNKAEDFDGEIGDLIVRDGAFKSDAQITSEYDNQSDPDNFGTSSEWVLVSSGITVTEQVVNTNYTSNDPIVTLTGTISIEENLVNTDYTSLDPTITLTPIGVISVTEQAVNTNYTSLDPIIGFTGLVSITEQVVNTNYEVNNPAVTLTSTNIDITESTVNTQYSTHNPSILLTPEPLGIVSTVCFNGLLVDLSYNGTNKDVVFDGEFKELSFNGTIQTTCNIGSIKTNC